jgi:hypothetical protein
MTLSWVSLRTLQAGGSSQVSTWIKLGRSGHLTGPGEGRRLRRGLTEDLGLSELGVSETITLTHEQMAQAS